SVGILAGLTVIFFLHEKVFPNIPQVYLLLALALIPIEIFFSYVDHVLLGSQHIKEFNYVQILQTVVFLALTALMLLILRAGVIGAILGALITWFVSGILVFHFAKKAAGGVDLKPNKIYLKRAATYGIQAHLANILGFLNYRVDMFLINFFLGPAAVGFYSVGVGLVEKLWMVSQAAGKVLFPRVSAETDEQRLKEFTPLVARTVLWTTAVAAVILALLSRWIVQLLYSETFLPAVSALRALLIGVIAISVGQVLGNDIAGRGLPKLNIYTSMVSAINNIILNFLWIPRYGILGAAWASTVSYTISFLGALFFYCRVSGNQWTKVIFPKKLDLALYLKMVGLLWQSIWNKVKRAS
ncbi:MAG: flippase, partial [Pseudothermotoga sp.]